MGDNIGLDTDVVRASAGDVDKLSGVLASVHIDTVPDVWHSQEALAGAISAVNELASALSANWRATATQMRRTMESFETCDQRIADSFQVDPSVPQLNPGRPINGYN